MLFTFEQVYRLVLRLVDWLGLELESLGEKGYHCVVQHKQC